MAVYPLQLVWRKCQCPVKEHTNTAVQQLHMMCKTMNCLLAEDIHGYITLISGVTSEDLCFCLPVYGTASSGTLVPNSVEGIL
jgi:hypothetical protein